MFWLFLLLFCQQACQQARKPASQQIRKPASKSESQPASQPSKTPTAEPKQARKTATQRPKALPSKWKMAWRNARQSFSGFPKNTTKMKRYKWQFFLRFSVFCHLRHEIGSILGTTPDPRERFANDFYRKTVAWIFDQFHFASQIATVLLSPQMDVNSTNQVSIRGPDIPGRFFKAVVEHMNTLQQYPTIDL